MFYLVSIEGIGDGSGNYCNFFRPGNSLFTSRERAALAIQKMCEKYDLELTVQEIIRRDKINLTENIWINITYMPINPIELQNKSYYDL
jgi:hypothetical protein